MYKKKKKRKKVATKIIEKIKKCNNCKKETIHKKNSKQMNWIMHLSLTIMTGGIWILIIILILIWHSINKSKTAFFNKWICTECGKNH
jgi:uncharacterized integral membrane protein